MNSFTATSIIVGFLMLTPGPFIYAQRGKACKNFKETSLQTLPPDNGNKDWKLVFEDNFDTNRLDTTKWLNAYPWGRNLIFNPEKQYYTPEGNIEVAEGTLRLITKQEILKANVKDLLPDSALLEDGKINSRNFTFTSGMVFSKTTYQYGKFEIRCRLPKIKGVWPAFWMFGQFPCYEEIDVFEFMEDKNSLVDMTIHGEPECGKGVQRCHYQYRGKDYTNDFHTFSVEWDELQLIFKIDGKVKRTYYRYYIKGRPVKKTQDLNLHPQVVLERAVYPTHAMHVIANMAVKKETGIYPAVFEIDYIRVYQRMR